MCPNSGTKIGKTTYVTVGKKKSYLLSKLIHFIVKADMPTVSITSAMGLGLVQVVPEGVSVGRGALFQCTSAFWGLNQRSQGG